MFTQRPVLAGLLVVLSTLAVACGAAPDGTPAEQGAASQPGVVHHYDESGNPLPDGEQPDPTAGQEGEGDLPKADAGPPADSGAPGSDTGAPGSDAGAPTDSGSTTPPPPPPPPPAGTPGASLVAAEAIRELAVMKTSTYDHTTSVDESKGQFNYDCSGFVGYDLSKAMPDALATVVAASGTPRPLAKDFESSFEAIPTAGKTGRWHRVTRASDLVPGDVVAWLKPADVASSNTGHVLVVRLPVTKNPKRADEWLVPITDSTSTPHGATDSRTPTGATGLGTGTIGLLVDASGGPIGYRWTGGVSAHDEITSVSLGHAE